MFISTLGTQAKKLSNTLFHTLLITRSPDSDFVSFLAIWVVINMLQIFVEQVTIWAYRNTKLGESIVSWVHFLYAARKKLMFTTFMLT